MKKILFTLLFLNLGLFAQFNVIGSIGVGGGPTFAYMNPDLKELNSEFVTKYGFKEFEKGIFGYGGGLTATLGNYRVGFYSLGGKKEITGVLSSVPPSRSVISSTKQSLEFGYTLGIIGYEFFTYEDLHIAFDIGLGKGKLDLQLSALDPNKTVDWQDLFDNGYRPRKISSSFFQYQPSLVVEYVAFGFMKFFVAGDYIGTVSSSWKADELNDLVNAPKIKFNGFSIRAGIFVGIFI